MTNEAYSIVYEYIMAKRLMRLGYTQPIERLNVYKAECFAIIDSEIDRLDMEASKRGKLNR